jgi:transposase
MCPEAELSRDELLVILLEQRQLLATTQTELTALRAELLASQADNTALREEVARLQEALGKKGDPPSWAKSNRPVREQQPRKKRAKGTGRRCVAEPDVSLPHAVDICPQCGHPLTGGWEASTRDTLVFPQDPVQVVRHICWARRCGCCGTVVVGKPDPVEHGLVGQHLVDARGMTLIAYWHIVCRMPLRIIQQLLFLLYACSLSLGALRYILDDVAQRGTVDYEFLRDEIRQSEVVHMDETGWREDGKNGYVWAAVTKLTRYFERHGTRSGQVPQTLLGEAFCGIVVCDGYKGYDPLACQLQRCWVHLLRKGQEIKTRYPDATEAHAWVDELTALYREARALVALPHYPTEPEAIRQGYRQTFEQRVLTHVSSQRDSTIKEQARLAKFLTQYSNELFVFVHYPEVCSENNPAERGVRPLVITRKVCGGTRSAQGSKTKMTLQSLFQTLQARGRDPITAVEQMLLGTPIFATKKRSA